MDSSIAAQPVADLGSLEGTASSSIEHQLAFLIEASATLLASPESPVVLQTILDLSKRLIEADAYSVWRKKPGEHTWEMVAMHGLSESYSPSLVLTAAEEEAMPREPQIIEDIHQVPVTHRVEAYRSEGIRSLITVPLRIHGEYAGTIVFYYRSPRRFPATDMRAAGALGNLAAAALGAAELYEDQQKLRRRAEDEERKSSFLAEAGRVLLASLDYEKTLASVVELAVPAFADWACVDILDASGEVRRVANKHTDPEKIRLNEELRQKFPQLETDIPRIALRTGRPVLIERITQDLIARYGRSPEHVEMFMKLGIQSLILAPLVAKQRSFGMLMFVTTQPDRRYTASDFALALELARRAALAMENARLYHESQKAQEALARSNAELRHANEDLNQFAYSASHDLREPLRMLILYTQMLERTCAEALDAGSRECLRFITDGAQRMDMLISDLLDYMRVVNTAPAVSGPIEASEILERALTNLGAAIQSAGAQIRYSCLPGLRVEPVHLLQLFQNIIGNAIKYRSERRPEIEIWSCREGTYHKLCVKDNGIGIPREYSQQVFGIFKRLHDRSKYPGTGVGLAICQKIVDRYGGRIWVESEEGRGSTFCFTLPGI